VTGGDEGFSAVPSVLAPDAVFEGVLSFRGAVRIEGRLRGDVLATGALRIEAGAVVQGRVEVDELVVAGTLQGEVTARRRLELLPSARVAADLRTPRLALADGCVLDGRCRAGASAEPASAEKGPAAP
jgi:cytoskeletal protein CcmA (bactofilin family)